MEHRARNRPLRCVLAASLAAAISLVLAACGGGSNQAIKLLGQTFAGRHHISSGELALVVTVDPSGPSGLKGPLTLSVGGPFQNLGAGRLPASDFDISLAAMGTDASLALISTGTNGYVSFQGASYRLPQATYRRLESSFGQLGSAPGGRGGGALGRLGIEPQRWLVNPQIVGDEGVDGIDTTHIRAGINVAALLADLNRFLERAASVGVAGASSLPHAIPAATRQRIAAEVRHPSFNVWTGVTDRALRRMEINLTVPVSGQLSALLGRAAVIGLTLEYSNLNRPQTITAPTRLEPYGQFQDKLRVLIADFEGGLASGGGTGGAGTAGAAPAASATGSGPNYQGYTDCVTAADGILAKLQTCAPLLNGQ